MKADNWTEVKPSEVPEWAHRQGRITTHPIIKDEDGEIRYKPNFAILWLIDHVSLEKMWKAYEYRAFSREEFMQVYRDMGYTLSGFEEIWHEELDKMEAESEAPK